MHTVALVLNLLVNKQFILKLDRFLYSVLYMLILLVSAIRDLVDSKLQMKYNKYM